MVSTRVSIAALDKLKERYKNKISNYLAPKIIEVQNEIVELNKDQAEAIIKDLEEYAVKKYPGIVKPFPRCQSQHSSSTISSITVGLEMKDSPASRSRAARLRELKADKNRLVARLEKWNTSCLERLAGGEGFVSFIPVSPGEVDSFNETSDEYDYHNNNV